MHVLLTQKLLYFAKKLVKIDSRFSLVSWAMEFASDIRSETMIGFEDLVHRDLFMILSIIYVLATESF